MSLRSVVPVLLLVACGVQEAEVVSEVDVSADDASELTSSELKVATTGMTVWLRSYAVREVREGRSLFVLRGRASVNLENAFSYVPDDGFCTSRTLSARTFEVACDASHEVSSLLSGLPLFVRLDQPGGKNATVRFVLEPRFVDATGTARIWLNAAVKPIFVPEVGLTYRGRVRSGGATAAVVGGVPAKLSRRGSGEEWNVDFGFEALRDAALGAGARFTLNVEGIEYAKKAGVAFGVAGLELARTEDAYAYWPTPACTAATQTCLNAAGAEAKDYEACGSYREVQRCHVPSSLPELGLAADDRSRIDTALSSISAPITVTSFYVQASGSVRPTMAQVIRAWQRQEATGASVVVPEQTAGQVNVVLDAFSARSLVPAIQQTVLQQSFKAARLSSGAQAYEVLYFTAAARFVVIRLP